MKVRAHKNAWVPAERLVGIKLTQVELKEVCCIGFSIGIDYYAASLLQHFLHLKLY